VIHNTQVCAFNRSIAFKAIFSARIGLGFRALAVRDWEGWVWFWIGSHADYDRLLKQL